ncbi:MAG: ROK family protein [candidate division WOR-3 bacterium]|nr:ROK family protein [candidate division WOR-3 bacterium]
MKYILGIDIGGTNIKAGLVHNGKVLKKITVPTHAGQDPETSLKQIKTTIGHFVNSISKIGIGIAGIIDSKEGIVRYSPNLKGWQDIPLVRILEKEFKKPVRILNDVNAILLGEWIYGAGKGYRNVFLFTLGTGVGGAAICEGKMLFGAHGFAGEFGHATINFNGPRCLCGNYGCLERYVGSRYIIELAEKKVNLQKSALSRYKELTPRIIAIEARKKDAVAKEVFEEIGQYIGIAVSNIVNLFDPEIVIISGGIARAGKVLFEPIRKTAKEYILGYKYRKIKIVPARLGDSGGILGAAYFAC